MIDAQSFIHIPIIFLTALLRYIHPLKVFWYIHRVYNHFVQPKISIKFHHFLLTYFSQPHNSAIQIASSSFFRLLILACMCTLSLGSSKTAQDGVRTIARWLQAEITPFSSTSFFKGTSNLNKLYNHFNYNIKGQQLRQYEKRIQ